MARRPMTRWLRSRNDLRSASRILGMLDLLQNGLEEPAEAGEPRGVHRAAHGRQRPDGPVLVRVHARPGDAHAARVGLRRVAAALVVGLALADQRPAGAVLDREPDDADVEPLAPRRG